MPLTHAVTTTFCLHTHAVPSVAHFREDTLRCLFEQMGTAVKSY